MQIWRRLGLALVFVWFFVGGIGHFVFTDLMAAIVPLYVAHPRFWVLFTGVCELAGAIAILWPPLRSFAGLALALLAICVTPANLEMALHPVRYPIPAFVLWLRIAFQPVLIWIIWRATRPNRQQARTA